MTEEQKLDPIALAILAALEDGKDYSPQDIAKLIADVKRKPKDPQDLWRRYLPTVKQQALFLARNGHIHFIRKGEVVEDYYKVKGLIKYRLIQGVS